MLDSENILTEVYKKKNKKIISKIYQVLRKQNGNNAGYMKAKWEKELNIEISQEDWRSMWIAQHPQVQRGGSSLHPILNALEAVQKLECRNLNANLLVMKMPYLLVMPQNLSGNFLGKYISEKDFGI